MRRKLLILLLGGIVLIGITWTGAILPDLIPHRASASVQTTQAGPYQITLQVDPNPPLITKPATLSFRVVRSQTRQLVTNAHITLDNTMETMDMGPNQATAPQTVPGTYQAQVQFTMSGPWDVRVTISTPGAAPVNATFEVTAQ